MLMATVLGESRGLLLLLVVKISLGHHCVEEAKRERVEEGGESFFCKLKERKQVLVKRCI